MVQKFICHSKRVLNIAREYQWLCGARYTNLRDVKHEKYLGFLDIDWKNYSFSAHLDAAAKFRPMITVAKDIEDIASLKDVLRQADYLKKYCRDVAIVPKDPAIGPNMDSLIPDDFIIGYSVPTRYGGTAIPLKFFGSRPIHLLGGRPDIQRELGRKLNVVSIDTNRFTLDAAYGDYFDGKAFKPHPLGGYVRCLRESFRTSIGYGVIMTGQQNATSESITGAPLDRRDQFLIEMYNQLMNEISRHIMVTWQSIATLVTALAAFTFVKEDIISYNIAVSVVLFVSIWYVAHVYDSSYWYNRNLAIIANIERQFLRKEDLREIHHYFGKHRPNNNMISHLRLQRLFAFSVAFISIVLYFAKVLYPFIKGENCFYYEMAIPIVILIFGLFVWYWCHRDGNAKYKEFLENSPGKEIDTSEIRYGNGHGFS